MARFGYNFVCHVTYLPTSPQERPRFELSYNGNLRQPSDFCQDWWMSLYLPVHRLRMWRKPQGLDSGETWTQYVVQRTECLTNFQVNVSKHLEKCPKNSPVAGNKSNLTSNCWFPNPKVFGHWAQNCPTIKKNRGQNTEFISVSTKFKWLLWFIKNILRNNLKCQVCIPSLSI